MKVSIITVVFNGEKFLESCIQSVLNQDYNDIEYILIDGCSIDASVEIIKKYKNNIAYWISEKDKGIYDAMNKGIQIATGDVIGILNSDDVYYSNTIIEVIVKTFKTSNVDAVYGNIVFFDSENFNKPTRYWCSKSYYSSFFEDGEVPPHPSLFVTKKVYDEIGLYKIDYQIAADHEFMFRMLKLNNRKSFFLDEIIVKMRNGGVSTSGIKSYIISTKELIRVWNENGFSYPKKLFLLRPIKKISQLIFK